MTGLFDFVWDALAVLMANPVVVLALQLGALYLGILWLASSFWVYRDLGRRTRNVITPFLAGATVILSTPFLFPLALVAYRIARPQDTVSERRVGNLQQLLLEVEADRDLCPSCEAPIESDWVRCPLCRVDLAVACRDCENPIGLDWTVCAWCAADVPWSTELDEPDVAVAPVPAEPRRAPAPVPTPAPGPSRPAMPAGWPLPADGLLARIAGVPSLRGVQEQLEQAFQGMRERLAVGDRDGGYVQQAAPVPVGGEEAEHRNGHRPNGHRPEFGRLLPHGLRGSLPMIATEPLPELAPARSGQGAGNGHDGHRDEAPNRTREDHRDTREDQRDMPEDHRDGTRRERLVAPLDRALATDPPDARLAARGAGVDQAPERADVPPPNDDASRSRAGETAYPAGAWNGFAPRPTSDGGISSSRLRTRDRGRSRIRQDSAGHEAQPTSNRG